MILAIDQGTSSTTALVVTPDSDVIGRGNVPVSARYPLPGWVEQDGAELWTSVQRAAQLALADADHPELAGVGLANQRETIVAWDRRSGRPLAPAVVWQDRRTADRCEALKEDGWEGFIRSASGLPIDPYFSATKFEWMLTHCAAVREAAARGVLCLGTLDSWILWNMADGKHVTDASNASRTMLMELESRQWSTELIDLFGIPKTALPAIVHSTGKLGKTGPGIGLPAGIPITGVAGDQQASLFGHLAHDPGAIKVTYGTGAFLLQVAGQERPPDVDGLLTTVAWHLADGTTFAREGSVFVAGGLIQWLRDGLRLIDHAGQCDVLGRRVSNSGGAVVVPAFVGLGAPHWDPHARGAIFGLTAGVTSEHICRSALEAIAHQVADVLDLMEPDVTPLRVDGGAARSDLLLELQATITGRTVIRPSNIETTGLGAAYLAGIGAGVWSSPDEIRDRKAPDRTVVPKDGLEPVSRETWRDAVERSRYWASDGQAPT